MKKLILFVSCCWSILSFGQTSVYHPFPDSNASWNFDFSNYQCPWGDSHEYYSIILTGDTSINGQVYHKFHVPYIEFISAGCTQYHQPGYFGAIRNDNANRKVHIYPEYGTEEELLYDFTLQVGDTVEGHLEYWADEKDTVISIDSVLVGDSYRKRWFINQWYEIYLIEGIGSTFGLIEASPGSIIDAPGYNFLCFRQDGMSQYPNPSVDCDLILSVWEKHMSPAEIDIFPNPTYGKFQITGTKFQINSKLQIQNCEVVDLYGKAIRTWNPKPGTRNPEMDISGCPAGVYFVRVLIEDVWVVKKIIKVA
jgi:hypothetical protein